MGVSAKKLFKITILIIGFCILFGSPNYMGKTYAAKIKLNKQKITLVEGDTYKLKLKNISKKVKWSSSDKKIATISSKGNIKAKSEGSAVVTAKAGRKKYTCKVTVKSVSSVASKEEAEVFGYVNGERRKQGLSKLKLDVKLQKIADKRAKEIARKFDHKRPNGKMCYTILDENKYNYRFAAENIAGGQETPKSVVKAWMHSPGHKTNLMNPKYNRIGVAYYKSDNSPYTYYWVQIFTN